MCSHANRSDCVVDARHTSTWGVLAELNPINLRSDNIHCTFIPTMAEKLGSVMERLSLNTKDADPELLATRLAEEENGTLKNTRPRKQTRKTTEELLTELENEFLAPSSQFSPKWLNQLQK